MSLVMDELLERRKRKGRGQETGAAGSWKLNGDWQNIASEPESSRQYISAGLRPFTVAKSVV